MTYKPKCQGTIYLVGLGPGDAAYLNPGGAVALRDCDVVVGFRGYIEMAGDLLQGKELVSMELGQELERAAKAVDMAYEGKSVAVVSSGDPGIYGMSGPCLLYTSPSPRDLSTSRMPSSA